MNPIYFKPSRMFVESVEVGSKVLDPFGKIRKVVKVNYRGNDVNGKAFVGYETQFDTNSTITNSIKEGELVRTVATSKFHNSAELNQIEKNMSEMDVLGE